MEFVPIHPSPMPTPASAGGCRNVLVLAEGFFAHRKDVFLTQVRRFADQLLKTPPFSRHQTLMTVSALWTPASVALAHVTNATRCDWRVAPDGTPRQDSDFATFESPFRALYCRSRVHDGSNAPMPRSLWGDVNRVMQAIDQHTPLKTLTWSALVLIDNEVAFGGMRTGDVAWAAMDADWIRTAIHELGHSVFGLADEYDNDGPASHSANEPSDPNVTVAANRAALLAAWQATPSRQALWVWHSMIGPTTPTPSSEANPGCSRFASARGQRPRPGVPSAGVGLFEGADYSPCNVYRPSLLCLMRNHDEDFCPVCEWSVQRDLIATRNPLRGAVIASGLGWTAMASYTELASAPNSTGMPQARYVVYDVATGEYTIYSQFQPTTIQQSPFGTTMGQGWTSLSECLIGGEPHLFAHSLPLRQWALFRVAYPTGAPVLDLRLDLAIQSAPWTQVTTFVWRDRLHVLGYDSATGAYEITRIEEAGQPPVCSTQVVRGTALDPTVLWLKDYSLISAFTLRGTPFVLKHKAATGEVHLQSMDPPGQGAVTFRSKAGHWNPGATLAVGYEADGRSFILRSSTGSYLALDWVWPGGTGMDTADLHPRIDLTSAITPVRIPDTGDFMGILTLEAGDVWVRGGR
jgi:hypothetical protein